MGAIIECRGVTKIYQQGAVEVPALPIVARRVALAREVRIHP